MQKLLIQGKKELSGAIYISGSKNATLPILASTILCNKVKLTNVPLVKDIHTMSELLKFIGLKVNILSSKNIIEVNNPDKNINTLAPYKLVKTMRAGVLVLGPLLAKYKNAKISLPGGCAIGSRPVDLHLFALKRLGAKIKIKNGYIVAQAKNGLKGTKIIFPIISVGATENAILAAFSAKGKTTLFNCAVEPEVKDLIKFLNKLGGKIKIIGRKITINECKGINKNIMHEIIFDRIEAGTYMIAAALIGKKIILNNTKPEIIKTEIGILKKMGVKIKIKKKKIEIYKSDKIKKINVSTKPYPGFPTYLQAQLMVLMTRANGTSRIKENIFENRYMHVPELKRMGADININDRTAVINGPSKLTGAQVMATDLRASVSLVLAALVADKSTIINRIYHLDRGYELLEKKLKNCKANIKRI